MKKTKQYIQPPLEIYQGWTKIDGKKDGEKINDLEGYIYKQLSEKPGTQIMIGTDSAWYAEDRKSRYLTVIVFRSLVNFRTVNHIIKRKSEEMYYGKGQIPTGIKLNGEINRTAELALWFRETIKIDPEVHLDVNPIECEDKNSSFQVYKYIKGYFESMNFKVEYKPCASAATAAADYFL